MFLVLSVTQVVDPLKYYYRFRRVKAIAHIINTSKCFKILLGSIALKGTLLLHCDGW